MGVLSKAKAILGQSFGPASGKEEREGYIDAFHSNNFRLVMEIIERRPEALHWTDENGATALHWAGTFGRGEVAKWLLEQGADPGASNNYGYTPLHSAAGNGSTDIIGMLVAHGADLEPAHKPQDTPLLHAANCAQRESIMALVGLGANVAAKDHHGKTALDLLRDRMDDDRADKLREEIEALVQARTAASVSQVMRDVGQGLPETLKIGKPLQLKKRR